MHKNKLNIAIFASHNGTDLQAVIDACEAGKLHARVCAVLSNNLDARALQRGTSAGIDTFYVDSPTYGGDEALTAAMLEFLDARHTDMILLAGYLKKISADILARYPGRVFNIHPALLPKYGGKGMYGMHVHRAVINAQERVSGITVHRANGAYDEGEVVLQTTVALTPGETAETLAEKILKEEHIFIVQFIDEIISGNIPLGDVLMP